MLKKLLLTDLLPQIALFLIMFKTFQKEHYNISYFMAFNPIHEKNFILMNVKRRKYRI